MIYNLYGSEFSIESCVKILEEALSVRLEERESSYQGGKYFRFESPLGGSILLKKNIDIIDNLPAEPLYPHFNTILYVNTKNMGNEFECIVFDGFSILRSEEF